ncbi:MAG: ATP-binding protein [Candidatus Helarchaeota archaeon]
MPIKHSYFPRKSKKPKPIWKKLFEYSIFFIFLNRIIYYTINYLSSFSQISYLSFLNEFFSKIIIILDVTFYITILLVIISLIEYIRVKKELKKQKIMIYEFILILVSIPIIVICSLSYYNYISNVIISTLITFILNIIEWTIKILIFFGVWIVILIILVIKTYYLYGKLKYNLSESEIISHAIILKNDSKKLKGISILEVKNIPKNISTREKRFNKKNIEKIAYGNHNVYFHYHLTILMNYIPNLAYEVSIHRNRVKFRIIISSVKNNKEELLSDLKSSLDIITKIYQTSFPDISFNILSGLNLKNAWSEIFGGLGNYKIKVSNDDYIKISQTEKDIFLRIIKINNRPQIKAYLERTQIDSLISSLLSSNIYGCSFVVNIEPVNIYKFKDNESYSKNVQVYKDGSTNIREQTSIREDLLEIRHTEITAIWKTSVYFILKSLSEKKIESEAKKVMAVLDTVFSGSENSIELKVIKKTRLLYYFSLIVNRRPMGDKILMTSEHLATYLHLPEESFPSIERSNIPLFEIPTSDIVNEKIVIGSVLFQNNKELFKVGIDIEDLRLNMFVTGLIGMGKTSLVMNILKNLVKFYSNINWMVLDWKGDYNSLIKEAPNKILVLRPGTNEAPFQINMFDPENSNPDEHVRKLTALIIELFKSDFQNKPELSVQMERVCREVVSKVVSDTSRRSLKAFFEYLSEYEDMEKVHNRTIGMTINALINRFDRFRSGNLKKIFDVEKSNVNFNDLVNMKVIFDFNYLLSNGGTKKDVRFLMNLVLKYVIDKALQRGLTNELKHIVVVEDAQLLVPAVLREVPETSLGEDIPLLLRGVGEGMITIATRPEISPDIISNSGIKVSFKSTYDSKKIANYQNLNQEQEEYLKIMPKQEAIITIPSFSYPFRIKSEPVFFKKCNTNEIYQNNKIICPLIYENIDAIDEININNENIQNEDQDLNFIPEIEINELENNIINILDVPKNKFQIAQELNISIKKISLVLKELISRGTIKNALYPVFSSGKLEKVYYIKDFIIHLENDIKSRIEKDFVIPGILGHINDKFFNYSFYSEDIYVKIFVKQYEELNKNKFSKIISDLVFNAFDKNIYNIILIVPFYQWKKKIEEWFEEWGFDSIYLFTYNYLDWQNLKSFIKSSKTGTPISIDNSLSVKKTSVNYDYHESNNEILEQNRITNRNNHSKLNRNNHSKLITEITNKYGNLFPITLLEKFKSEFPIDTEMCEYLGCNKNDLHEILKPIKKYIHEINVCDLEEPYGIGHTYYGWRDIIKGKLILKNNIAKLFYDNNIEFEIETINNYSKSDEKISGEIILPQYSLQIFFIYDRSDIIYLYNKLSQVKENSNHKYVIIAYSTEIKSSLNKKLNSLNLYNKIQILRYDWAEIDPWIRNLKKSKF